ncbi:MAG: M20/M25/M40 family metallo-hydrolase [Chloroflexi bacterium]|jgi:putative selenium metabolism hydrolase|nr:M20/M25/M40 family metallo-hydrolase [Chloroflexota bacterium]
MVRVDWDQLLADCVDFTQRMIQTPSMPHEEAQVAQLIAAEMRGLGFAGVHIDGIGNVIGRIRGQDPKLAALVLNSHTDHVDPGDPRLWPVPPFSGSIVDGHILGRGACDIKGPLAVQVYSMAAFLRAGIRPRRDVVFTGVVQEEVGGAGAQYWVENLDYPVALVVLGEPSENRIALGHRGIVQTWVTFAGRSVHASMPESGDNPNYALATFLGRLAEQQGKLSSHPLLGRTSVTPTVVEVDTTSFNVTPAWTRVLLDCRTASESLDSLHEFYSSLATDLPFALEDAMGCGPSQSDTTIYGYYTAPESEVAQKAKAAIGKGMGREAEFISYQFATDGRLFVPYDIPVIGYAPGEGKLAHTVRERISIAQMGEAIRGYVGLLQEF